jgi:ribosomal protein L35AE/L33A
MQGIIANFRQGKRTYKPRHYVIVVESSKTKDDAKKFIDKVVEWKSPAGKIIKGRVASSHGNKGALRVIMERGLPGQAISQKVDIK